jgi:uncharacterized protein YjbJ (UPF0337 family)
MDKDRIVGGVKKVSGAIKEGVGRALKDRKTIDQGQQEQSEGRAQSAVGHAKDAIREIAGKK